MKKLMLILLIFCNAFLYGQLHIKDQIQKTDTIPMYLMVSNVIPDTSYHYRINGDTLIYVPEGIYNERVIWINGFQVLRWYQYSKNRFEYIIDESGNEVKGEWRFVKWLDEHKQDLKEGLIVWMNRRQR